MKYTASALVFLLSLGSVTLVCARVENTRMSHNVDARGTNAITRYLLPVLVSMKKSGRVYYVATCQSSGLNFYVSSQLEMHPPAKSDTELAAIHGMFGTRDRVSVVEAPSGIVRVTIGDVPTTLLSTKISALALKPLEQYNRTLAIAAIEGTPEVQATMQSLGVRSMSVVVNEIMAAPQKGIPHLPAMLKDVTMDEAFDAIVTSFGGIIYYGYCPEEHLYYVNFTGGSYFEK